MNGLFDLNNGVFAFLGKLFDVMLLGFIYLICCIPIITIGPATTALYYVIVKTVRKDRGYITKEFFKSFRENFKVGAISFMIALFFTGILLFNIRLASQMKDGLSAVLIYIYICTLFLLLMTMLYLFPVLSRFKVGVFPLFKMSFFLAIRHFPTTLLLVAMNVAVVLISYLTVLFVLVAVPVSCYLSSFLMERILKQYMPKQEDTEGKLDQWYFD